MGAEPKFGDDALHRLETLPHEGHGHKAFVLIANILRAPASTRITERGIQLLAQYKRGEIVAPAPKRVLVTSLIPTQRGVYRHKVEKCGQQLNAGQSKTVIVMRYLRRNYLLDGHHHASAAALAGESWVMAFLLDVATRSVR